MERKPDPPLLDPATGRPARDHEAELRLGCLKAALELRSPGTPPGDVLALAERFHAWTKGQAPTS